MPILDKISSLQNPRVKDVVKMHRSKARRESGLIIVEGFREIMLALDAGLSCESIMLCREILVEPLASNIQKLIDTNACFEVSQKVFAKMAYREHSQGLLAVMKAPGLKPDQIKLSVNPLLIVLESVEKPGNLGAILRTADAVNADAVIVCDPLTDIYNPNVIRSSVGCVFTRQVAACTSTEALDWLHNNNIRPLAAALTATQHHFNVDLNQPLAFILGTEADGLSDFWLENASDQIKIPMLGKIDSLNVSNSAAVLLYEALRQRRSAT